MISAIALLLILQDKTVLQEDTLAPKKSAVLQVPKLETARVGQVPRIQQQNWQDQATKVPALGASPLKLNQESIDEIKAIRKRIGLQIFKDKQSDAQFDRQLERIHTAENHPVRILPLKANPAKKAKPAKNSGSSGLAPTVLAPTVERPRVAGFRLKQPSKSQQSRTLEALFSAIEHLDQSALQLEKEGQFEKSGKLRKLSRKIQKQARTLLSVRDN